VKQLTQHSIVSSPTPTENRLDALLALRGLACLMVVIAHCNPPRSFLVYHAFDFSWILFSAGGVAVRIFFCLSGYLMGKAFYTQRYTLDRSGILNFWRNRALRVFPLYYFSLLATSLFVYTDLWKLENWKYIFRIVTFAYDQTVPVAFNGALWTLSTEVQFYLLVPFIFIFLCDRVRNKPKILLYALILTCGSLLLRVFLWFSIQANFSADEAAIAFVRYIYVPLWMNLDVFGGGFLLNFWMNSDKKLLRSRNLGVWRRQTSRLSRLCAKFGFKKIAVAIVLLLYLVTAGLKYQNQELLGLISPTLTLLATVLFIYAFETAATVTSHRRNRQLSLKACRENPWRLIEVLGVLSYGIYIWHLPILAKIQPLFVSEIPIEAYFLRFFVTLILSTILATITYYLVELPAANLKRLKPVKSIDSKN